MTAKANILAVLVLVGCAAGPAAKKTTHEKAEAAGCESPLGFIPEGGSLPGFRDPSVPAGKACVPGYLHCTDGVWTGIYIHPECSVRP